MISNSLFQKSQDLVKAVEKELIVLPKNPFLRYILSPILYLLFGLQILLVKPIFKVFLYIPWVLFATFGGFLLDRHSLFDFLNHISGDQESIIKSVLILSILMVMFDTPSSFVDFGLNQDRIARTVLVIKKIGFKTKDDIDLLNKNIEIFTNNAQKRITAYKWILGIVFIFGKDIFKHGFDLAPQGIFNQVFVSLSSEILGRVLIAYIIVAAYERSINFIFQAIVFACNDLRQEILEDESQNSQLINEITSNSKKSQKTEESFEPIVEPKSRFSVFNLSTNFFKYICWNKRKLY
jgi:hypothetical protein